MGATSTCGAARHAWADSPASPSELTIKQRATLRDRGRASRRLLGLTGWAITKAGKNPTLSCYCCHVGLTCRHANGSSPHHDCDDTGPLLVVGGFGSRDVEPLRR